MINIERYLDDTIIKIYEGLYDQIKESDNPESTLSDINTKLNIIIDALGLDQDSMIDDTTTKPTTASKNNTNTNNDKQIEFKDKQVDNKDDNDDNDNEKTENVLVVEEAFDLKKGNYKLNFSSRATDHFWYPGKAIYYFDTVDSIENFMKMNDIPFSYNDLNMLNTIGSIDNIYYSINRMF